MTLARAKQFVALLALAASVSARAQDWAETPRGRHVFGSFSFTPRLELWNAGVDTNVFQTLRDPVRDEVYVLRPEIDADLALGDRVRMRGSGYASVNYFRREGEERSTDFYGEGEARVALGRLMLFGGGGGGQFTQRFSIDVDDRLERQEERAHAGASLRLTPRISLVGRGSAEVITFAPGTFRLGGDVKESMDRNTLGASGSIRYGLTPRTDLIVTAEALEDRFFSEGPDMPRERRSYRYLGGFEIHESSSVHLPYGTILAGLRVFPGSLAQGSPPYQGPVLAAALTVPLHHLGRIHVEGGRDVLYAASLVDLGTLRYRNAFVYERYLAEDAVRLPLGLLLVASGGVESARYLLPYAYPDALHLSDRTDHRWTGGLGLTRRLTEQIRLGGHVAWARRVSSIPFFSYEGLTYGLTAEVLP